MARKQRKLYSLDEGLVEKFEKICKKRDMEFSAAIGQMMESFVAKDGEMMMDDLQAPRIAGLVKRTVSKEIDRVMGMLHLIQVDTIANLYSVPAVYKKELKAFENTINSYFNEKVLNDNRVSAASQFSFNEDGIKMIENVRQYARNDIKARKKVKEEFQQA